MAGPVLSFAWVVLQLCVAIQRGKTTGSAFQMLHAFYFHAMSWTTPVVACRHTAQPFAFLK